MRIVSSTIVSQETDILEAFVRYHAPYFETMVMCLKRSPSLAYDILHGLQREGFSIEIRESHDPAHWHPEIHTAILHNIRERLHPDWIIALDCDEFLKPIDPNRTLADALSTLPDTVLYLPWQTYIPRPEDDQQERHLLLRTQWRRAREPLSYYKVLVPHSAFQLPTATFDIGAHRFLRSPGGSAYDLVVSDSLALAHFPLRSAQQLAAKAFTGWLSHVSYPKKAQGSCYQMKVIFDLCKEGRVVTPELLRQASDAYAVPEGFPLVHELIEDPVVVSDVTLRFPNTMLPPVQALAEIAEDLAALVALHPTDFTQ